MAIEPDGPAPYAPPATTITAIEHHRERGLPTPITTAVLGRAVGSDTLAPRVLKTLRLLDLVTDDGQPTATFSDLAKTSTPEYKPRFAQMLRSAYADVFQYVDPAQDSTEKIRDQFRHYVPRGQQERMVMLFIGLCEYAGIAPAKSADGGRDAVKTAPVRRAQPRRQFAAPKNTPKHEPPPPPPPHEPPATDGRERYLNLLIKMAESEPSPELLDRIEKVLGIDGAAPKTSAATSGRSDGAGPGGESD